MELKNEINDLSFKRYRFNAIKPVIIAYLENLNKKTKTKEDDKIIIKALLKIGL